MDEFCAGVLLIDKPKGPSSFTMVRHVRKMLGMKKVGHAGTLDPFASGLLIVCAGRPATKMISSFMDGDKEYVATLELGRRTTTLDPEGEIVSECRVDHLSELDIELCLEKFRGELMQKPPAFSALKHKGKPLYYYARKGIEVEKPPRRVVISELERLDTGDLTDGFPALHLRVVCSKGTYIRTLAADIGDFLGCGAFLTDLRRTRSGSFSVDRAVDGRLLSAPEERSAILQRILSVEEAGNLLQ